MNKHPTRRDVMLGVAAAATATALVATPASLLSAADQTPIAQLWGKAEELRAKLAPFKTQIATAERTNIGHLSGWAYLDGDARALGSARHDTLMTLLVSEPQNARDIQLMSAAANDHEMVKSPGLWAIVRVKEVAGHLAAA